MKKITIVVSALILALTAIRSAEAAFSVGGENGWQLSTDGIVDVFSTYNSTSPAPGGARTTSLLEGNTTGYDQRFGVGIGLLPSVVGFNVKAPTTNGVDSTVRIGIYPTIQNKTANRFDTSPNIDFREIFYTAKGAYGELLAGRALNLFMGKNILTDMTLLTAGVVPGPDFRGGTTLGHIGSGYLYANFSPQIRYTTPDFGGVKVAIEVGEPYNISPDTAKTNSPRVESEISYAKANGDTSVQAWLSGLYQTAPRSDTAAARPGKDNESIGGAYGVGVGFSGLNLLFSGYGGKGLGMLSAQDGSTLASLNQTSVDAGGKERLYWGFLAQATYKVTSSIMLGANYGQTRQEETNLDSQSRATLVLLKNSEAATTSITYNFNKFTQFIFEYTYAQNTWFDSAKQHSNQFALGTMFYW